MNQLNPGIGHRNNEADSSVINFDGSSPTSRIQSRGLPTSPLLLGRDADDDKYKRRSALSFLSRWWRSTIGRLWNLCNKNKIRRQYSHDIIFLIHTTKHILCNSRANIQGKTDDEYTKTTSDSIISIPWIHHINDSSVTPGKKRIRRWLHIWSNVGPDE